MYYGVGAEITITPQWENTNDVKLDLYFINGKVECVGIINGISGTSSISATFKLERKGMLGWSLENAWKKVQKENLYHSLKLRLLQRDILIVLV